MTIIKREVKTMADMELAKKAMVAAATEVLVYKRKNQCSDDEAIAHVVSNMNSIIAKVR